MSKLEMLEPKPSVSLREPIVSPRVPRITISKDPAIGYRLQTQMLVALPIAEVFEFFSDASKLALITPPWVNFEFLTALPVEMKRGTLLDYRIRLHGIPIRWQTEICEWEPCYRFVDQQLIGPYKRWYHEHSFESVDGGTLVKDDVHYVVPGGSLVNRLLVQPDLVKIFRFRHDSLSQIFAEMSNDRRT
jgi:ligand-binding SRPBCC domain-containing protein